MKKVKIKYTGENTPYYESIGYIFAIKHEHDIMHDIDDYFTITFKQWDKICKKLKHNDLPLFFSFRPVYVVDEHDRKCMICAWC